MSLNVRCMIGEYKAGRNQEENMTELIQRFQPVICKYARKLYSLEYEDATQELTIALVQAVYSIAEYENEGQSISYLVKGIKFRFYELQRQSIMENEYQINSEQIDENMLSSPDDYTWIEMKVELDKLKEKSSFVERCIIDAMILGVSDTETANILQVSRQYVNRKRREIIKILKQQYKNK